MTEVERIQKYFNKVDTLSAVCRSISSWAHGDYPELEIGKTYKVSHIGVLRSSTNIMLTDFPSKEYNTSCFDILENGIPCKYTDDPRFFAPVLRENTIIRKSPKYLRAIEDITIPAHLKDIEREHNINILLAVESGSRAWGFPSNDSDWDVRMIYVHKPEWYFKVKEQRDVIEYMYNDDVDLSGWELRKALELLSKGNTTVFEWLHSPKIYYIDKEFARRISEIEAGYFHPVKSMYHYNRIYNKHNERYLQRDDFNVKRFLYYLRGVLACRWIEQKGTLPPVCFEDLVDAMVPEKTIKTNIEEIIRMKKEGLESNMISIDNQLVDYAQKLADYYNKTIGHFRPEQTVASTDALDSILYDMVMNNSK